MRQLVAVLAATLLSAAAADCVFDLESENVKFDLTKLGEAGPFSQDVGVLRYFFAACTPLEMTCGDSATNLMAAMASKVNPTKCLTAYGSNAATSVSLLGEASAGIQVQYKGGNNCASSPSVVSSTTLDVQCDKDGAVEPHNVVVLSGSEDCGFHVQFKSSAGCPIKVDAGEVMSPLAIALVTVAVATVLYLGCGWTYNVCARGASGMEALPHIDFWRGVCGRVAACCCCRSPSSAPSAGFYADMDDDESGGGRPATAVAVPDEHFTDAP
ncbi:hypothetical protein FNF29_05961 [Cafeteria roenbergensis]|uniref:Autophagy-related protein 27 n=1 Tax=Cafeteria roenbergensis TaxID=33653 RepID=A0A5A8C9C0_CAFRO|nr:hypothetical protein FNF29_05961 [Cafeteria roenbergensis]|eukprot:KAA0149408.1 hypothetical protein FNF29_05961 [Cafeteria roenbergensis]